MKMRRWAGFATAVLTLSLTACGSGDDQSSQPATPSIKRVVVFGDSLSDAGTYTPAARLLGGGRFTTNPGPVWVETVAKKLDVPLTPAVVGYGGDIGVTICPQPKTCFDYAQGGSLVTDPNGINHSSGALTYPVKQQLANFYAASGNAFNNNTDLVFVLAGANDILKSFMASPGTAMPQVTQAATELAGYVKDMILHGATQLYVLNLPDISLTPTGTSLSAQLGPILGPQSQALLQTLVNAFNTTLQTQLAGTSARMIDFNTEFTGVIQKPSVYGFSNSTDPACDAAKINALVPGANGSSLFCSADTLVAPNADQTYLFADGVHPTTAGHNTLADNVWLRLLADKVVVIR